MQLFDLMKCIKTKSLPKFLVFTGTEYAIMELYIQNIVKSFNLTQRSVSVATQIIKKQRVVSLVGENNLYICRYDNDFTKQEKDWENIDKKLGNNYFILILSHVDKRGKFCKFFENCIVEFVEQDFSTVENMVSKQINLTKSNLDRLIKGCNNNYSRCLLEIDKIKCLAKVRNMDVNTAYQCLLTEGTIYEVQDTKLQEFTNSVLTKDKKCFEQYKALQRNQEPNMILLTWLYNAVRNQLCVQTVSTPNQQTLGISYFFIKECLDRKGYYTTKELKQFLDIIRYCEQGIKLGWMEEANSVEYVLANVL